VIKQKGGIEMEKEEEELFVPRYVPVIFPPCTDIYFISKNIDSNSFRDDVREKLLDIMGRNLISMYDTCGFNPLLLIIDAESPSKLDSLINSAREQEIDIHPTFISFTASPESIIKRFGMVVDQAVGREGDISDKIKENPAVLDLLEYIITAKLKQLDSEYSEEKRDALIEKEIRDVKNKDAKILIKESNIKEPLEKVKDAQKYLDAEFIRYIHIEIPPVLGIIFLRFPIKTSSDKIESVIDGFNEDPNVIDIYEIIGEYDYIIKVHQESISDLHSFCEKLYDKNIQTIMKCVLRTWKDMSCVMKIWVIS
jgi:DNA-binding Lrp family transcriptional regulator